MTQKKKPHHAHRPPKREGDPPDEDDVETGEGEGDGDEGKGPPNCKIEVTALGPYQQGDIVALSGIVALGGDVRSYVKQGVITMTRSPATRINEAIEPGEGGDLSVNQHVMALEEENAQLREACDAHQKKIESLEGQGADITAARQQASEAQDEAKKLATENEKLKRHVDALEKDAEKHKKKDKD